MPGTPAPPRGAKTFLTETISRVREAGASGGLTVRADSAFYSRAVLTTARRLDVRLSVTVRQDKRIGAAIEAIDEEAWTPIPYWLSTPEVSGADVAETTYTAFAGTPQAMDVRLIVRRVRPTPGSQLALFTMFDYHAFVTDREGDFLHLEADHRRHAIVEQSIAALKSAGLAHLPSGTRRRKGTEPVGEAPSFVGDLLNLVDGSLRGAGRSVVLGLSASVVRVIWRVAHRVRAPYSTSAARTGCSARPVRTCTRSYEALLVPLMVAWLVAWALCGPLARPLRL